MSIAVINISGFVKHIEITEDVVRYGRLRVVVPRILADWVYGEPPATAELKCLEFRLKNFDEKNHIAYFDDAQWV